MARTIERETLREWMHQGQDFALVDTLPRAACEQHHLPGAIHIVSDDIEAEAPRRLPERERTVMVYCGSTACKRSEKAAARLDALGYRDVREYVEGRRDWEDAGLPVESGSAPDARAGHPGRHDGGALAGELFPYPTLAESLKLCARTFTRDVSPLSRCAG